MMEILVFLLLTILLVAVMSATVLALEALRLLLTPTRRRRLSERVRAIGLWRAIGLMLR